MNTAIVTATVMILRPMKRNDPTEHTYKWGQKAVKLAKSLGYRVIDIEKDDNNYYNVSNSIEKYDPRLLITFSHGCVNSIQGQNECTITRKYSVEDTVKMMTSGNTEKINVAKNLLNPLGYMSSPSLCQLNNDPCDLKCLHDTNVGLLKNKIVFAVACFTGLQLSKCAIQYGADTYVGYKDLFLFPTDSMKSQDITGEIQLEFLRNLLLGKSVRESEIAMRRMENTYIKMYKKTKYVALPMLWNQKYRTITGNLDSRIYEGNPIFGVPILPFI